MISRITTLDLPRKRVRRRVISRFEMVRIFLMVKNRTRPVIRGRAAPLPVMPHSLLWGTSLAA